MEVEGARFERLWQSLHEWGSAATLCEGLPDPAVGGAVPLDRAGSSPRSGRGPGGDRVFGKRGGEHFSEPDSQGRWRSGSGSDGRHEIAAQMVNEADDADREDRPADGEPPVLGRSIARRIRGELDDMRQEC